eukprot:CAMPEP_0205925494 /NCGR_PEP_ID=MMETSP1325-20131115/18330_1 /ASSEMBLY_ACC=CAM_ASM_000708 /TAXON_ID=236786 /ORGANISM="Florenciella sp., Strain RCC1007" /LENGTH=33 /DNA_ID= /DNA_START= /DNA_END= /DNA_ORIENTATION=
MPARLGDASSPSSKPASSALTSSSILMTTVSAS